MYGVNDHLDRRRLGGEDCAYCSKCGQPLDLTDKVAAAMKRLMPRPKPKRCRLVFGPTGG